MNSIYPVLEDDKLAPEAEKAERLALLVAEAAAKRGGQGGSAPLIDAYLAARRHQSIPEVNENLGGTEDVPFFIDLERDLRSVTMCDLPRIADRIVGQLEFNRKSEGREWLRHQVGKIRRRLARDHCDIALNALSMSLWWFTQAEDPLMRCVSAEMTVLDDLLEPYTVRELLGSRRLDSSFSSYIAAQKRRRAALNRVAAECGILEIDVMAEYAIVASGRTVCQVVSSMRANRNSRQGMGATIRLWSDPRGNEIDVCVRDGRIELDFRVDIIRTMTPGFWEINQSFPTTVEVAMAGEPLYRLARHRLLNPGTTIVQMRSEDNSRSYVELEQKYRIVRFHEPYCSEDEDDVPF